MATTLDKVEELKAVITEKEKVDTVFSDVDAKAEVASLERMNFRLSDAIREGASVTEQAYAWGAGDKACALHAAVISAKARGYL